VEGQGPVQDNPSYQVQQVEMPAGLVSQTGGLDFFPDGRMVACFMRGEVMIYNPHTGTWAVFAEGLQSPLGVVAVNNAEVLVMQLTELTRITDTDGDGHADLFVSETDEFGVSGNYHEFNYGPARDSAGNLFFSLNTGSSGGGIRSEVRGQLNKLGREGDDGHKEMFSVTPYRGWIMKLTTEGKLHPYASGFRSPNGLGFDLKGNLFVTDNQSDWVETSSLYHVEEGRFYGHVASLVWKKGWETTDPFNLPIQQLEKIRTHAAVLFPQGIIANSPSQPLADATAGKFGPFAGQLFIGEMNRDRIVRVMLENVGGQLQGACIPFIDGRGLHKGNNRLAFAPDGSLWVGQTNYGGWAGDSGMQKIVFSGVVPMDVATMKLTRTGFDLTFTQPVDSVLAADPKNYKIRHYKYEYKKKSLDEGIDISTQVDVQEVPITKITVSNDHKSVSINLEKLRAGYVYECKLDKIANPAGRVLDNTLICYTLNQLIPN